MPGSPPDLSNVSTFLTVLQAAAYLGISKRTLYRLIEDGRIGYLKVSERGLRLRPEHLEHYLSANTHEPGDRHAAN